MLGDFKNWGLRSNEISDIFLGFIHLKDQHHNILKLVITEALKYKNLKINIINISLIVTHLYSSVVVISNFVNCLFTMLNWVGASKELCLFFHSSELLLFLQFRTVFVLSQ